MCKTIHEALYYHNSDWLEWFIRAGLDEHEALALQNIFLADDDICINTRLADI